MSAAPDNYAVANVLKDASPRLSSGTHRSWLRTTILLLIAAALFVLTLAHVSPLNGPRYWTWDWRHLPAARVYPTILAAGLPLLLAQLVFDPLRPARRRTAVTLVTLAAGLLLAAVAAVPLPHLTDVPGFIIDTIHHGHPTGYLADAIDLRRSAHPPSPRELLATYPTVLPTLRQHPREKPPGAVWLYYLALTRFSERTVAAGSAVIIFALTILTIPAVYLLVARLFDDRHAAFAAATLAALAPGLLAFYPNFDACYPLLTCAAVLAWALAIHTGRPHYAIAFGTTLAVIIFFAYNPLVLGLFFLTYALAHNPRGLPRLAAQSTLALATLAALYLLLYALTRYNPLATFLAALHTQHENLNHLVVHRPLAQTWAFDLLDFALGAGWLLIPLTLFSYLDDRHATTPSSHVRRTWLGLVLLQLVVTALTGLLQAETARVWIFLLPLTLPPAASALAALPPRHRLPALLSLILLLAAILQNMTFLAD